MYILALLNGCHSLVSPGTRIEAFRRNFVDAIKADAPEFHACLENDTITRDGWARWAMGRARVRRARHQQYVVVDAWSLVNSPCKNRQFINRWSVRTRDARPRSCGAILPWFRPRLSGSQPGGRIT
jgi:hypothetical protein